MRDVPSLNARRTAFILVAMFLLADMALPHTMEGWSTLDEEGDHRPQFAIQNHGVQADTYISQSSVSSTYNTSATGPLSDASNAESRLLLRFPMNYTAADTILDARIELQCNTTQTGNTDMQAFTAGMDRFWNGSWVSWNNFAAGALWSLPGADDLGDRTDWEPPTTLSSNGTLTLNVTSLAQNSAKANQDMMSVIVSSLGATYSCHLSETTVSGYAPVFIVNAASTPASAGGEVEADLPVENGAPWMESDFILNAVSTPRLGYAMNTGSDVEIHLSSSPQWRSAADGDWHYSTLWNTFASTGTSGAFDIPASDAFSNGTEMYMRVRSVDSNGQWGGWSGAYFLLPNLNVTDNGDGTASMAVAFDDVGMMDDFIEDTYVSQTQRTINYAGASTLDTSMTSNKERLIHMRLRLNQLGLHDNLTIVDSNLTLERNSHSGDAVVSLHGMEESGVYGTDEMTWNIMADENETEWNDGGRSNGTATIDLLNANQSDDTFVFTTTHAVQNYLDASDENPLDMMLAVRGKYEGYTNGAGVTFHSVNASSEDVRPVYALTYKWGSGAPSPVSLTAPVDGLAVWNQSGHNFSGNTEPTLNWTAPTSGDDVVFQLARDEDFRLREWVVDTRVDNDFSPSDSTLNFTGADALDLGNMYFWRMATVDSNDHYGEWVQSSFLISSLESTYLGGDRYEFRIKHGNGSADNQYPVCEDTFIESGNPNANRGSDSEMTVDYNSGGSEITALLGCNLVSNLLPDGYAVESANLSLTLTQDPYNAPHIGVWESRQNNWSEDDATWSSYDGINNWDTAGAKGLERASLLNSVPFGTTYAEDDRVEWNVTLAVQNAMREDRRVDFMVGMVGAGTGTDRSAYFATGEASSADRPELTFVYVPGSDALPSTPSLQTPLNGSWSIGTGVDQTPVTQPELDWTFTGSMALAGYIVQLDTQDDFSSENSITNSSWNDAGFDVPNTSFTLQSSLEEGNTWYWRVRAVSTTNQIGGWSNVHHFHLPSLATSVINSTKATVEWHHHGALPHLNTPHFVDTYVVENGSGSDQTKDSSTTLLVGDVGGYDAASLIRIPLDDIPQPTNARVTTATMNLFSQIQSDVNVPVAIRPVLQNWTGSANATTYDGTNNWSERGGRNIGTDIGSFIDLQPSVDDAWMAFDISEAIQVGLANGDNHVSLMLYASSGTTDSVTFASTDATASLRPYVNVTWEEGQVASPTSAGVNSAPAANAIVWDADSHALLGDRQPTLAWTFTGSSTVTDWRVLVQQDASDDMAGLYVYDSRVNASMFDLANRTFTPDSDFDFSQEIRWMVQPINNGMLGPRGNSTLFFLPEDIGEEVSSTHATVFIQEHNALPNNQYPSVSSDTYIDSGSTVANQGNNNQLYVGYSPVSTSNTNLRTSTLMSINFSSLPFPANYEVVDASLDLTVLAQRDNTLISVSNMLTPWSESSTWAYPAGNTSSWLGVGAYHSQDSDVPFNAPTWVNSTGSSSFNVTALLQHAISQGHTELNVILQAEEHLGGVDGRTQFASSEHNTQAYRPSLNFTYRVDTAPWHPSAPSQLAPLDGATLWDTTQPRPSGQDSTDFNWSLGSVNETQWLMCFSLNARMMEEVCYDSNALLDGDFSDLSFDANNRILTDSGMSKGDFWTHWRVRADQDNRIGEWSDILRFRNPNDQGTSDGNGNHSLNISRGSVFTNTGVVPSVPDVEISPASSVNRGAATTMSLGTSASGASESKVLLEFDLSDMPWPTAMTPTGMVLRMYQLSITGTSSTTVAAYACNGFSESTTVFSNAPSCSTSELTRSTLTLTSPVGWVDWDLTGLAQSNIANGNTTMTVMLARVGSTSSSHLFYTSEYNDPDYHPHLVFDYIDNVNGIQPPAQPSLVSPNDGEVLYSVSSGQLVADEQPVLTWMPVAGATGYIVTIEDESGPVKYRSWEDSEITNTTFEFDNTLAEGSQLTWWVQAVNQSVPGPSSSRWTFAVGDPNHVYNGDHTFTYTFQTGNEVPAFGHTNIGETSLKSAASMQNFGDAETVAIGSYCGLLFTDECRMTLGFNSGQVPFASYQQVHSASLGMYVDEWTSAQGASSITFHVHPLLGSWNQLSATWNGTTSGSTWGAPGMQAGVDYGDAVSSTTVNVGTSGWVWFDLSTPGMTISSQQAWIVVGVANTGSAHAEFYSSEATSQAFRPQVLFNTTNITTIDIAPSGTVTTDADTTVVFSHTVFDHTSTQQTPSVAWSATAGSVGNNGLYTPSTTGTHQVMACFGLVCGVQNITVTPGAPVTLIATPLQATITADDTLDIIANMYDQNGNVVGGQTITYAPSNGTMSIAVPSTFEPFAVGNHTIVVTHPASGQQLTVNVQVTTGAPSYFSLSGCEGTVPAGQWCDIDAVLYDQFGNELPTADAGDLTWSTTNGNYSELNQQFFPDHVGVWWLNLSSTSGAAAHKMITVGHGEMASLEISTSELDITADDRVYLNTTRVDVRGNRLAVVLPSDNWTMIADGQLTPGAPATWDPVSRGSKTLEARYETTTATVTVNVVEGIIRTLILEVDDEPSTWDSFTITADETLEASVFAIDAKGNQWEITANWTLTHPTITSPLSGFLENTASQATTFTPYFSSAEAYMLTAEYDALANGSPALSVGVNITVNPGVLHTLTVEAVANNPVGSTGDRIEMTADYALTFTTQLADQDANTIPAEVLTWLHVDEDTGVTTDITTALLLNSMTWEATTVGNFSIHAYAISGSGFNITDSVQVVVLHGTAVSVAVDASTTAPVAGDFVTLQITGTDSDGNTFPQNVQWSENMSPVTTLTEVEGETGSYRYQAQEAGLHSLVYAVGQATSTVELSVSAQTVAARLELTLSSQNVAQLDSVELSIRAYDAFDNEIDVSESVVVDAAGRAEVTQINPSLWTITTLDEGVHAITVNLGSVQESTELTVEGNLAGFFEAGGTLYYVGAGLLGLVAVALLGLLAMFMRSGSNDWDDEDDEDDEVEDPSPGPSGPAPGPSGPAPAQEEPTTESDQETRVDDDGTEWWEDEEGVWYYRMPGDEEWQVWTD